MNKKTKKILLRIYMDLKIKRGENYTDKELKQIELDFDFIINVSEGMSFIDVSNMLISDALNNRKKEVIRG